MSKVRANGDHGFVGLDGVPTLISEHDEFDAGHPLVAAHPELFDAVPEEPKRPVLGRKPAHPAKESDDRP